MIYQPKAIPLFDSVLAIVVEIVVLIVFVLVVRYFLSTK